MIDSLKFGPGKDNENSDFRIIASSGNIQKQFDVLIFTDSRGSSLNNSIEWCWTDLLMRELTSRGLSFLFVSRPKDMTVYFTLINFLQNNDIRYKYLFTNVGFVDLTPKKLEFINDIIEQSPWKKLDTLLTYKKLCRYRLSNGEMAILYNIDYSRIISKMPEELVNRFRAVYFIGTPEFSKSIKIERKRPKEFFSQLSATNILIESICDISRDFYCIPPFIFSSDTQNIFSYDAVHFTDLGHLKQYETIVSNVEWL